MSINESQTIDTILKEVKVYPPLKRFSYQAMIKSMAEYEEIYRHSIEHPTLNNFG